MPGEPPPPGAPPPRRVGLAARLVLIALLVPTLIYVGYLAIVLGPDLANLEWGDLARGYHRTLMPAEVRGAPLRTSEGGADRVYLLTTQSERIVPLRLGRVQNIRARQMLHVDLWAFDPATAQPAWRRRIRTFEDDSVLLDFAILGADATTLWLFVRQPLAVSLRDGGMAADAARLDAINPVLVGKYVDEPGYVAFGAQGLQLTLSDSTQWVIHGDTFVAQPRASAASPAPRIAAPAYDSPYTSYFQLRGLPLGTRWVGVLTDAEAARLQADPVVPGAKPGERPGAMADFLASQHVPDNLNTQPVSYRLWSARVTKVSAAPRDWPAELPNNWGTRDQFSDYQPLPESPPFLQAGLLGDVRPPQPYWFREPDSVLVLHHDKVGGAGRLQVARIAGPGGRVVWNSALALADLDVSMYGPSDLAFLGSVPNPAHDASSETSREEHQTLVALHVESGAVHRYDLTAESTAETAPVAVALSSEARVPN